MYRVSPLITQREEEIEQGAKWQGGGATRTGGDDFAKIFHEQGGCLCFGVMFGHILPVKVVDFHLRIYRTALSVLETLPQTLI